MFSKSMSTSRWQYRFRLPVLLALVVAALVVVSGCGGGSSTSGSSSSASALPGGSEEPAGSSGESEEVDSSPTTSSSGEEALSLIPEARRADYEGIGKYYEIGENPYADWTPPKQPVKICLNMSYQGNVWRQEALDEAEKLNEQMMQAGVSSGPLDVTNANNDVSTEVSQLNGQVSKGCQVILAEPASPTGLCPALKNAREHDVLVITVVAPAQCDDAINTDFNEYRDGYATGKWLAEHLEGKGKILMVGGIPGVASSDVRGAGAEAGIKSVSGSEIVGEVAGEWTPSVAKTQTLQFLSTHPEEINGVWQAALMMPAAGEAFEQQGRELPTITGFGGECAELAYWKENEMESTGYSQAGGPAMYEGFYVANLMLAGSKPVTNLIIYTLPTINDENLDEWWEPSMTVHSTCYAKPKDNRSVADSYFKPLFEGGSAPKVTLEP